MGDWYLLRAKFIIDSNFLVREVAWRGREMAGTWLIK